MIIRTSGFFFLDKWETVEVLAAAGANLNSSDCHFGTPLHVAACQGSIKCSESLLRAGIDGLLGMLY